MKVEILKDKFGRYAIFGYEAEHVLFKIAVHGNKYELTKHNKLDRYTLTVYEDDAYIASVRRLRKRDIKYGTI